MVKRICVLYPDGSLDVIAGNLSAASQLSEARSICKGFNKRETDEAELASFGEIQVDLMSFKERR